MSPPIPDTIPEAGLPINVRASFESLRFLPRWFALGHNNRNPALTLYDDRLEIRTLGTVKLGYDQIKSVDARSTVRTKNLTFTRCGRLTRCAVNVSDTDDFRAILRLLADRKVPLSKRARLLAEPAEL